MNIITTNNMLLPIPVSGVDPGPDYSLNVNACLATIDSHNHAPGFGVQITPNGLNINEDLSIGTNNLILVRSLRFNPNPSALSGATDLGCLYEAGVDLYYNDGNGNQIRITSMGSVTGSTGTITGLPSGTASASYSSPTFTFQSATSTAANLDCRSIVLRNSTASSFGLTLSPPTLSANYSLILPALPSVSATFLQLDTSGNITAVNNADGIGSLMTSVGADAIGISMTLTGANAIANSRTRATGSSAEGVGGVALSNSSSLFATTSNTPVNVTNLSVTLTTSGRPVFVMLQPDQTANLAGIQLHISSGTGSGIVYITNTTTSAVFNSEFFAGTAIDTSIPPGAFAFIDISAMAGSNTYQVSVEVGGSSSTMKVYNCRLLAYEL